MIRMLRDVYGDRLLVAHPEGVASGVAGRCPPRHWRAATILSSIFRASLVSGVHQVFRRPARYFTTVREPLLRLESYYNFVKHWEIYHHHKAARERNIRQFFEFLMDRNDIEVSNLQCLLMCGEKSFEQARRNLEENFEFVISLPRLAQAPPLLAKALEWPFVPELHHENETRHNETIEELPKGMIATLSAANSEDRQSGPVRRETVV